MTIPASQLVDVVGSILSAGGNPLSLNGMVLTQSRRVPIGSVLSFTSAAAVQAYFGALSTEAAIADIYFLGFAGCTAYPSALLFTEYPLTAVPPHLRGANIAALPLAQMQALSGSFAITVNGVARSAATISLAAATSFSSAAAIIAAALAAYDGITTAATTIAVGTATGVIGSIQGNVLTVSAIASGTLVAGGALTSASIAGACAIVSQLSGTTGGVGTYTVSSVQSTPSGAIAENYGLLTVAGMTSGAIAVGQDVTGTGVAAGTTIAAFGTGTGAAGTYILSGGPQTVSATTISTGALKAMFDSVSGALIFVGGTPGAAGTIGFAQGTLAAGLGLLNTSGGVLSQGAKAAVPAAFMGALITQATNWATFMTAFNPDASGNAQKLLLAEWTASTSNRYAYVCWDQDPTPATTAPATASLGYLIAQATLSGTILVFDTVPNNLAAFVCGMIASIDYNAKNGRISLAYKNQSGVALTVTDATVADNLMANGYNFYGDYATANQLFNFFQPGQISGEYDWADSYVDQIWLNAGIQLSLMNLLANSKSIPYNSAGYASIDASLIGIAAQGVNNGVICPGVTLSANQVIEVNTAAGVAIDSVLSSRGWYSQVVPASATTRAQRASPPINFWYNDGGSIQQIVVASIEVQ